MWREEIDERLSVRRHYLFVSLHAEWKFLFLRMALVCFDVSYQLRTVHLWGDFWRQSSSIHFLSSCSSLTNPFLSLPPNHHHSPPNPPLRRLRTIWPNAHRPRPPQIRQRQQMHLPRNSLHLLFLGSRLVRPHE